MTVVAFVLMLAIPVVMLVKRSPFTVVVCVVFGLFLGMTAIGVHLAGALNDLGHSVVHLAASNGGGSAGGRP